MVTLLIFTKNLDINGRCRGIIKDSDGIEHTAPVHAT